MITLTVLGCSGSASGPESAASSYLVTAPMDDGEYRLLLDLGPGAFGALYRYGDPASIDAIGLSHLHPDHCLDMCGFYVAARYSRSTPWPPIDLYGPPDTLPRLARAYEVRDRDGHLGEDDKLATQFRMHAWAAEQPIGPFDVRTARVAHPVEAYAVALTERATGARLTYSGDTGPCDALVDLAGDTDLLLCEAAFLEAPGLPPGLHLTGRQAAEHARQARAGTLMLTHIPPWNDAERVRAEARPHFAGQLLVARPGQQVRIG